MNKSILVLALSLVSTSSFASTYAYTCYPAKNNQGFESILKLTVNTKHVTIKDDDSLDAVATINPTYKPQKANANMIEYGGFDGGDEYQGEILIDKSLPQGGEKLSKGGYGGPMKIRARGEGYFNGSFLCVSE